MSLFPVLAMLCAAFAAGAINAIAGGGTLLTFPVLIWLGLDPKVANGTSTVALWPGLFGGLFGYRKELENSSTILIRLGTTSVIAGAIGAWLLIRTPSPTFARLVPFLILFATILFMSQGEISKRFKFGKLDEKPATGWWIGAMVFQFFSAMYGGYFGAGNGILMLAALGLLGLNELARANGIKNFLGICINSVAVLAFSLNGLVVFRDALIMAIGAMAGGYFGARMAVRIGQLWIRRGVIVIGFVIFVVMAWKIRH
ncbi:MAG TPA: sulfite exporter TauE/SafE family protein [Pyrinomonadaceae bacterium]|jgi:Predicted permeases|nr:sulfite exporter TauE/SafE family protein [Pyrinomonadaceae bacterium]